MPARIDRDPTRRWLRAISSLPAEGPAVDADTDGGGPGSERDPGSVGSEQ